MTCTYLRIFDEGSTHICKWKQNLNMPNVECDFVEVYHYCGIYKEEE